MAQRIGAGKPSIPAGSGSRPVIAMLDNAINNISAKRADFGAKQNRLEATVRNNANVIEKPERSPQSRHGRRFRSRDGQPDTLADPAAGRHRDAGPGHQLPQNVVTAAVKVWRTFRSRGRRQLDDKRQSGGWGASPPGTRGEGRTAGQPAGPGDRPGTNSRATG